MLFAPFATEGLLHAALDDLGHCRREIDNIRAALNRAFSPDGDAALGVVLAADTADFWYSLSLVAEACEWSTKELARIGDAQGEVRSSRREMVLQYNLGRPLMHLSRTLCILRALASDDNAGDAA